MKKVLVALLMAAIIMPAFIACKRGAEDPGLSLRSRDSRLLGTWKLSKMTGTWQYYAGVTLMTRTYAYDEPTFSSTLNPGSTTESGSGTYEMVILKGGLFQYTETFTPSGGTAWSYIGEDQWNWLDNDKSKAFVYLPGMCYLFWSNTFEIVELANKELKVRFYWKDTEDGETEYADLTWTFVAV
jgi:hypothetical protein